MLKPYEVEINGQRTTLLLADEDVKHYKVLLGHADEKQAPAPANKARRVPNKKE